MTLMDDADELRYRQVVETDLTMRGGWNRRKTRRADNYSVRLL